MCDQVESFYGHHEVAPITLPSLAPDTVGNINFSGQVACSGLRSVLCSKTVPRSALVAACTCSRLGPLRLLQMSALWPQHAALPSLQPVDLN